MLPNAWLTNYVVSSPQTSQNTKASQAILRALAVSSWISSWKQLIEGSGVRRLIIGGLDPDQHLLQKAFQKACDLAAHAHLAPHIPAIELLESILDLPHELPNSFMAILPLSPSLHEPLWIFQRLCGFRLVLEVELIRPTSEGCF